MPRPPRAFVDGIYHLSSHGSDTRHLFLSADERATFLDRLGLLVERFKLGLIAYALLGNHYHLVISTPDGRVSSALQQLHGWYSRWHNRRHGRSAHLFRAHFFARELTSDDDLLVACRYVAYNPVAAGLSNDPFSWPWSSAAASVGIAPPLIPLDAGPLRAALDDTRDWQRRYRGFIEVGGTGLEPVTSSLSSASRAGSGTVSSPKHASRFSWDDCDRGVRKSGAIRTRTGDLLGA